jgi:hypothetical protein
VKGRCNVLVEDGRGREPGSPGNDEVAVVVGLGFVRLLSGLSAASGRVMCLRLGNANKEAMCVVCGGACRVVSCRVVSCGMVEYP